MLPKEIEQYINIILLLIQFNEIKRRIDNAFFEQTNQAGASNLIQNDGTSLPTNTLPSADNQSNAVPSMFSTEKKQKSNFPLAYMFSVGKVNYDLANVLSNPEKNLSDSDKNEIVDILFKSFTDMGM